MGISETVCPADNERNKIFLDEFELGYQGYVAPDIRADAFASFSSITGPPPPTKDYTMVLEEAYATFLNLGSRIFSAGRQETYRLRRGKPHSRTHMEFY